MPINVVSSTKLMKRAFSQIFSSTLNPSSVYQAQQYYRGVVMGCSIDLQRNFVTPHSLEPEPETQDVHQLEKNDFTPSAEMTDALKDVLRYENASSDQKRDKSCLHLLLRHFVLESLGTLVKKKPIDEFIVSVGVITGSRFLAMNRISDTAVSRKRVNSTSDVYCWFIPLASVQYRMCLLTLLSVEQLQSMSSVEVVRAIGRGDLGYYSFPGFECRRISNILDANVRLGRDDFILCRHGSDKENHTVVLFSQKSPEFALAQLQAHWKVGFYCDEATYTEIVTPALAEVPAIIEKKLWTNAEFMNGPAVPNQLFVVDLDFMVKSGTAESHLSLLQLAKLISSPPQVMLFDSGNRRTILNCNCCDHFVCTKMNKRNLVYYILVNIINSLSYFGRTWKPADEMLNTKSEWTISIEAVH